MQVKSVQLYSNVSSYNFRSNLHNNDVKIQNPQDKIKSIYSKGMTNISFGQTKHESYFQQEINAQPEVLRNLAEKYFIQPDKDINMDLNLTKEDVKNISRIRIYASGSSKNAAEMAKGFIEKTTNIPVIVESASEVMNDRKILNNKKDLAIFVSQSGETADTLEALKEASYAGLKTIAVTNNEDSKIAKIADAHISLDAGKEYAVAATKSVTSSIFNLMVIGMKLGEIKEFLPRETINRLAKNFKKMPTMIEKMLMRNDDVMQAAEIIAESDNIYYYSKGDLIGSAKEGALKLAEITGKRVVADASGEAMHGSFASIKRDDVVLEIINPKSTNNCYADLAEITRKRGVKHPILMQTNNIPENFHSGISTKPLYVTVQHYDNINETALPIFMTIKLQQITNEVAKKLGKNPDNGGGFLTKYRKHMSM